MNKRRLGNMKIGIGLIGTLTLLLVGIEFHLASMPLPVHMALTIQRDDSVITPAQPGGEKIFIYESPSCHYCRRWDRRERQNLLAAAKRSGTTIIFRKMVIHDGDADVIAQELCKRSSGDDGGTHCHGSQLDEFRRRALADDDKARSNGVFATPSFYANGQLLVGYRKAGAIMALLASR